MKKKKDLLKLFCILKVPALVKAIAKTLCQKRLLFIIRLMHKTNLIFIIGEISLTKVCAHLEASGTD